MKSKKVLLLSRSKEDYLEAILDEGPPARVSAIAARLKVTKASVTAAVRELSDLGFTVYERYRKVGLTAAGADRAREIRSRHNALVNFLTEVLGVPADVAQKDACILEHGLSRETTSRLRGFLKGGGSGGRRANKTKTARRTTCPRTPPEENQT